MIIELKADREIIIGVVADSHVPDRVSGLHPDLLPGLKKSNVDFIFHAGDISHPRVMSELESVAPVYAVAGNRDFLFRKSLPMSQEFLINGVRTLLAHGHVDFLNYMMDKIAYLIRGYQFNRYSNRLQTLSPKASVYIFGHTHQIENKMVDGKLYFNPGSTSVGEFQELKLSFGLLRFSQNGLVEGEIIPLTGAKNRFGKWERI